MTLVRKANPELQAQSMPFTALQTKHKGLGSYRVRQEQTKFCLALKFKTRCGEQIKVIGLGLG